MESKKRNSTKAMHQIVNNNKAYLYLNVSKWAGSIMANVSDCRPEDVSSILTQSTDGRG